VINEAHTIAYTGLTLDRSRRADDAWFDAARTEPGARALAFWGGRCAVRDGGPVTVPVTADAVYLGRDHAPLFAVDLPDEPEETADIRALHRDLPGEDATRLAYARGLLHWHRGQRFCGTCGAPAEPRAGGHLRVCVRCAKEHYPRIEPAVIVLVEHGERCLLARHRGGTGFATLAGFVEVGEGLEDAVRREVAEETGVAVGAVAYQGSQAWPFPAGLMAGFRATALSDLVDVDGEEITEARWFTRAEVAALPERRPDSIEDFLVTAWLRGGP
jgi:NAD+ diphosphatase